MRIIKQGKKKADTKVQTTCSDCNTVFEFFRSEGKMNYDQREGDYVSINCPVCNCCVDVKQFK